MFDNSSQLIMLGKSVVMDLGGNDKMAYCPWCMKKNDDNSFYCIHCGNKMDATNEPHQLVVGSLLNKRYYVGLALRQGGFGITYVGCDTRLDKKVAIKEYFPSEFVNRVTEYSSTLTIATGNKRELFEREKDRFEREARILPRFSGEKNVVNVTDIFSENNTIYMVMEFIEGEDLDQFLAQRGKMSFKEIYLMLQPIVRTLGRIHSEGLMHRDISPANIKVLQDNTPILLDFGAAREFGGDGEKSYSVILKPGYAPPEQYDSHGKQGTWSDVYAMCATLYYAITLVAPQNSLTRMTGDTILGPLRSGAMITSGEEAVLLRGLSLSVEERIHTMEELDNAALNAINYEPTRFVYEESAQARSTASNTGTNTADVRQKKGKTNRKRRDIMTILLALVIMVVGRTFTSFIAESITSSKNVTQSVSNIESNNTENVKSSYDEYVKTAYGKRSRTAYISDQFGYTFSLPDDMSFYDDDMMYILAKSSINNGNVTDKDVEAAKFELYAHDYVGIKNVVSVVFEMAYSSDGNDAISDVDVKRLNHELVVAGLRNNKDFKEEFKEIEFCGRPTYASCLEYTEIQSGIKLYTVVVYETNGNLMNRILVTAGDEKTCYELLKCFS